MARIMRVLDDCPSVTLHCEGDLVEAARDAASPSPV